ncbi:hypothetical protein HJFPF1_02217 [Paramyrothecium foliicola]|nr:hypothetical protein HJFPF1_02217 [Paramyrothecium foliicola]
MPRNKYSCMTYAKGENVNVTKLLLKVGVLIETTDLTGRTPFLHAVESWLLSVLRPSLDEWAKADVADNKGPTALSCAAAT